MAQLDAKLVAAQFADGLGKLYLLFIYADTGLALKLGSYLGGGYGAVEAVFAAGLGLKFDLRTLKLLPQQNTLSRLRSISTTVMSGILLKICLGDS